MGQEFNTPVRRNKPQDTHIPSYMKAAADAVFAVAVTFGPARLANAQDQRNQTVLARNERDRTSTTRPVVRPVVAPVVPAQTIRPTLPEIVHVPST